jgi:lipopolysaccharide export system permease protein
MLLFDLGPGQQLVRVARAERASASDPKHWELSGYAASNFDAPDHVTPTYAAKQPMTTGQSAGFLQLANVEPQELSALTLYRMVRYLDSNRLRATNYLFALWSRIARNVAILVAVLFAVPFAFGSLRSAGAGARATMGLVIGLLYFFLQRTVESSTTVFGLNPVLLAWLPCSLLAAAALILYWRVR